MRKIIIEVEIDSDNDFNEIADELNYRIVSSCCLAYEYNYDFKMTNIREVYTPRHAKKPGFMGRDSEQEELEKARSQQIPFGAAA